MRKVPHRSRRRRVSLAQIDKPGVMPSESRAIVANLAAGRPPDPSTTVLVLLHRVADGSVRSDVDRIAVSRVDHVPGSQPRSLIIGGVLGRSMLWRQS